MLRVFLIPRFVNLKPTSSSKRHHFNFYSSVNKNPILKVKIAYKKRCHGKNNLGLVTVKHKGGGHKKLYRAINFKTNQGLIGVVFTIEYDPFRTANVASIFNFVNKKFFYVIACKNLKVGSILKSGNSAEQKLNHVLTLNKTTIGCPVFNVSFKPTGVSKISRAAGTYSVIVNKNKFKCELILSSGTKIFLNNNCFCNIGIVSNHLNFLKNLAKAGRVRWLNVRPTVRGVAMNPFDHPNGGGEGKKSSKNKTPWGRVTK